MYRNLSLILLGLLVCAPAAFATSFVVPPDEEMIVRADAIVVGTIEGSRVDVSDGIETIYQLRVQRSLKGPARPAETLEIASPGGELRDRGVFVPGAPHFAPRERVLLFLTADKGRWTPTDLTLGKFAFAITTTGAGVLVRDAENIVGWDRSGARHVERVRAEAPFLRFIEERVAGRRPVADYFVSTNSVMFDGAQQNAATLQPNAPAFPAKTYTDNIQYNGVYVGTRWSNVSAGVTFYKRTETNIANAADGGASVIQNALASWTNECGSVINLVYGGQLSSTPSANHDSINVVEFNDPQGRIGGSWTGAGTVAVTFISYFNPHTFNGETWWSIHDADVVFQDGYTASNVGFATAMTHEIGHGLGWRHSNAHFIRSTGADEPCNSSVEECSNTAIMYYSVISQYGFTLQPWDVNAAQAVYPGGSCGNTAGFYVITPCRLIDTRNATGTYGGPALLSRVARNIPVTGQCSIPSGATAVAINLAVVTPPSLGYVVAYPGPAGSGVPNVATINFRTGETLSNNAIVPLGSDGTINIYSTATSPMHIVIDVYGFFR